MTEELPERARVVVVGGGIVGCSVAHALTRRGVDDVVLLERRSLTSGTTWHAAGLVTQLRATGNLSRIVLESIRIFESLEAETGLSTGFRRTGQITIACNEARWEEVRRQASMAKGIGLRVELLGPGEVKERFPILDPAGVLGGMYFPDDGVANPTDATLALAAGARARGARILEHTPVREVLIEGGRVRGVETDRGRIEADVVVNCTGMWARVFGERSGIHLPLQATEHFYIVTEPIPGLPSDLPVLKSYDDWCYVKVEGGAKLMVGFFEPGGQPWALDGIPEEAEFVRLPERWDHLAPFIEQVAERIPVLRDAGIQLHFNGPESFTPDARFYLGDVPGVEGYYVACGFNSVGFLSGPGAGEALAEWIVEGRPSMDLWDVDVRRTFPFQSTRRYLAERIPEVLGLLYDMHWPFRQFETGRGLRRSPIHDRLAARGACFGEVAGWERPNWFAPEGVEPRYRYSFGRQNWFGYSAEEHRAAREGVALFDYSSFTQFLVQGPDAERALQHLCTADVGVPPGRIVYTQVLNDRGGIEADLTVTRLAEDRFLLVGAAADQLRDLDVIERGIRDFRATVTDVSSGTATLALAGPRSRELLARLTTADLSNEAFPFLTSREIDLGHVVVRAARISYTGELGWELSMPTEFCQYVYDLLVEAGQEVGLRHAGFHALNSLRLEKAFRLWGYDIGTHDTLLEAGLAFTAGWDKPEGFVGREALLRQREEGVRRRLVQLVLQDPEPLAYRAEPIWRDGELIGTVTSAMFGHTIGRCVCLGYLERSDGPVTDEWIIAGRYEVEIAWERIPARVYLKAAYDPKARRLRG